MKQLAMMVLFALVFVRPAGAGTGMSDGPPNPAGNIVSDVAQPGEIIKFAHYMSWGVAGHCESQSVIPQIGNGCYSSQDPAIIAALDAQFKDVGITPLYSWWGPDKPSGDPFQDVMVGTTGLVRGGILYEMTGRLFYNEHDRADFNDPRNVARLKEDLTHLQEKYFSKHPEHYAHLNGAHVTAGVPVFFWASQGIDGPFCDVIDSLRPTIPMYVMMSQFTLYAPGPPEKYTHLLSCADAVTSYGLYDGNLTKATGGVMTDTYIGRVFEAYISWAQWLYANFPGVSLILPMQFSYDDTLVLGRDNPPLGTTPEQACKLVMVARALINSTRNNQSNIPLVINQTSWNECFEGTCALPSDRYGDTLSNLLREGFTGPLDKPLVCPTHW